MMINPSKDPVNFAKKTIGSDPWSTFLGIEVDEVREGYARCSLKVKDEYCNSVERAHGAAIFAVSDQAFAMACNSTGTMALAVSFNITYMGAAKPGTTITAEAVPVNQGKRISVWNIEVVDSEGSLISRGEGIAYHKLD